MDTEKNVEEVDCQHVQMGIRCVLKDTMVDGKRVHHEGDHEVLASDVQKKMEEGGFNKPEVILKEDEQKKMSLADFKRWRQRTIGDLNVLVGSMHKELVNSQVRTNLVWNGVNSILKAFLTKGLVTPEEIEEAGKALMQEAQENLRRAKQAVEEKRKPEEKEFVPTPLDEVKKLIYK